MRSILISHVGIIEIGQKHIYENSEGFWYVK